MNRVTVVEAKARLSEILSRVESGQEIVITRRGAPIARLSAVEAARKPMDLAAVDAFRAGLRRQKTRSAELIRSMRDDGY